MGALLPTQESEEKDGKDRMDGKLLTHEVIIFFRLLRGNFKCFHIS
jgi:hypothetical protein